MQLHAKNSVNVVWLPDPGIPHMQYALAGLKQLHEFYINFQTETWAVVLLCCTLCNHRAHLPAVRSSCMLYTFELVIPYTFK